MTDQGETPSQLNNDQPPPPQPAEQNQPGQTGQAPQVPQAPQAPPGRQGQQQSRDRRFHQQQRPRHQGQRPQEGPRDGIKEVSIVIPLFNEEQSLRELYENIRTALGRMGRYEIIFVDDGSTDGSMRVL